ncbi:uncharacterized protein Bfra_002082 [Botrytis fragariae]|uniref:Nephrocystin 3-like N-terminal domain-containing protein n=1 Tax=Botrytis fragariae TaxID=1964551 RepID=A0A8H6B253_9HELO|nr:uncharacterized protein Bfra_002082 [Botrytis fragariae]KAF5877715.1 hypothetical protein Bfra_002082 [Botrytis fragariae]
MGPVSILGLTASIIACIQLAQALSKKVGLSEHNRTDLERMLKTLRRFLASYQGLKNIAAIDEKCREIINEVQQRLEEKNLFNRWVRGSSWDMKINKCLSRFDDIREQFDIAIQSDQLQIIAAVEKYAQQALCDTRDIKKNAQRIEDHIRDLKDDARDIRHDISLFNQSINTNHTNIVQHTRDVKDSMQDIKCTITQQSLDFESHEKMKARESKKKEVLQWLSTADPKTNHDLARKRFEPGTGSWFLQSNNYRSWKTNDDSFLWVQGLSGCGKTILCSTVVQDMTDYCANNSDCFIAYYYFSFNETEKQNANNLLRSILTQFLVKYDAALDDALAIYNDNQSTVPHLETLKAMLKAVFSMPGTFYLILDAVDECPRGYEEGNRQVVCELLREVSSWAYKSLHIFMTSRKEADIKKIIDEIPKLSTFLIRNENVNSDTCQYVKTQLENDTKLRKWSPEIKTEIAITLGDSANGMFLWVTCQLDALKRCPTPAMLRKTLKSLPRTLHATYERMLSNIHEDYTDIVVAALKWLVICHEKLTIRELAEAVAAGIDSKSSFNINNRFGNPDELLEILGSLVTLNNDDGRHDEFLYHLSEVTDTHHREYVQLSHFSVREYLTSTHLNVTYMNGFGEPSLHLFALECCLNYIDGLTAQNIHEIIWKYPFNHWLSHARGCSYQNGMETARYIVSYLDSYHWREAWFGQRGCGDSFGTNFSNDKWENANGPGTTIYYATFLKLEHVERLLIDEYNATVDVPLEVGECPPLCVAIHFENAALVRHFIHIVEDGQKYLKSCHIALELAIEKGGNFLLMVLMEILRLGGKSGLLMGANFLDHLELIANKCDLILKDDVHVWWKPFSYALLHPHQKTSAFFVRSELGIQSEWPMKPGDFPTEIELILLAVAIRMDSMERFQLLFYHIQTFGCPNYHLISSLAAFARCDNEAKLRFILERAVAHDLTETDLCEYIIFDVFRKRDEVVLKLLLDIGMHPDLLYCKSWFLNTDGRKHLLQQAVYMRWRAGISVLIERGADVNFCVGDLFDTTSFARYSPLKILVSGMKDPAIPSDSSEDSSENDHLIEELLVTGGARICEYDWKTFSDGSTDGGVFGGSDIEMGDNKCDDEGTDDSFESAN